MFPSFAPAQVIRCDHFDLVRAEIRVIEQLGRVIRPVAAENNPRWHVVGHRSREQPADPAYRPSSPSSDRHKLFEVQLALMQHDVDLGHIARQPFRPGH